MDPDEIVPGLLVGSFPQDPEDVERLKTEFGVTAVLNVQTEEDLRHADVDWPAMEKVYRREGIKVCRVPVRDFDEEDLRRYLPACVQALQRLAGEEDVVYVHCNMGVGRSPSVVVAYLHWVRGLSLDEAFGQVTRQRACTPSLDAIRLAGADRAKKKGP